MEPLGDIDGGVVQADGLSLSDIGGAVLFALFPQRGHGFGREVRAVQEEVHISVYGLHGGNVLVRPGGADRFSDFRRGHPQGLGQAEAGERVVAQRGIRRHGQQALDILRARQAFRLRPQALYALRRQRGDLTPGIHVHSSFRHQVLQSPRGDLHAPESRGTTPYHIIGKGKNATRGGIAPGRLICLKEKIQIFRCNTGVFRGSGGFRDAKNPAALIDIRRGGAYNIRILDEYQEGLSCPSN